jgi:hypothetical protein
MDYEGHYDLCLSSGYHPAHMMTYAYYVFQGRSVPAHMPMTARAHRPGDGEINTELLKELLRKQLQREVAEEAVDEGRFRKHVVRTV